MMVSSRWGMCSHNLPTYPPLYSNSPTPRPDVGGVLDWLGMAAMSFTLRTPAHCFSRVSRRQAASTPDFATANLTLSAHIGRYHCAPRLIPTSKVPRLRLLCLSIDGVTEAHQVCLVTSGIGAASRSDTR